MARKIEFPRIIIVEQDCLGQSGEVAKELSKGTSALIVSSEPLMGVAGQKIIENLESSGFKTDSFLEELATGSSVKGAQDKIKESKADIVLGVGGGNCIDIGKLSAAREKIPFISVPTAASHDGIVSPVASIRENGQLKSYQASAPIAIIADTKVIANAPPELMAAGCGDLIANYTAVADWKLANKEKEEYYGVYSGALSLMSADLIMECEQEIVDKSDEGVRTVVEALISAGVAMSINGTSRPCSGAEHLFSHALDKIAPKPALHGEQCGVGAVIMAYLHEMTWEKYRDFLKKVGAPVTAKELGIEEQYIIKALSTAHTIRDRYTILRDGLSEEKAKELAENTGVI